MDDHNGYFVEHGDFEFRTSNEGRGPDIFGDGEGYGYWHLYGDGEGEGTGDGCGDGELAEDLLGLRWK